MVKLVSWNIARREAAWRLLADADADVALLQEAVPPPGDVPARLNVDAAPCDPATALRHYVRLCTAARAKAVAGLDDVTRAAIERGGEDPRGRPAARGQRRRARRPAPVALTSTHDAGIPGVAVGRAKARSFATRPSLSVDAASAGGGSWVR